jgi:hypothetical protein
MSGVTEQRVDIVIISNLCHMHMIIKYFNLYFNIYIYYFNNSLNWTPFTSDNFPHTNKQSITDRKLLLFRKPSPTYFQLPKITVSSN